MSTIYVGQKIVQKKLNLVYVTDAYEIVSDKDDTTITDSTINDVQRLNNVLKIEDDSKMMLCIFWIYDEGHRKFFMYLKVLIAGVTAQTNTEVRSLFILWTGTPIINPSR